MRDNTKLSISKSLVRNAEVPLTSKLTSTSHHGESVTSHQMRSKNDQTDKNHLKEKNSLCEPALNSALRIVKEMKQTSEMKLLRTQNPPNLNEKVSLLSKI